MSGASEFSLVSSSCSMSASKALRLLPSTFPRLTCILLDGHPDIEPETLVGVMPLAARTESPLLLSMPRCQARLPLAFFASAYLKHLVYLDVSDLPGSLGNGAMLQLTINPVNLPNLRILKARGRELESSIAILLFRTFGKQLWSVDLSRNKLTDVISDQIQYFTFPAERPRGGDFAVEGELIYPPAVGNASFGRFCFIKESDWSATFSHAHRYLADAPVYSQHSQRDLQENHNARLDGRVQIRSDSADSVKAILSGGLGYRRPPPEVIHELDICRGHRGITHLYLNGNRLSAAALGCMIRSSSGHLQHLECDSMSFEIHEAAQLPSLLGKASLSGILGLAHVFRSVISSNLQVLRIHHSLVTQLLSVEIKDMSTMGSQWLAETCLLPRAELAYPEAFVPDMNPRLQSLILTHIPRYSTGPLIEKLINFLKLASIQERGIQMINAKATNRHSPMTLLGLRHIRFEFQHDPREALAHDLSDEDSLDPGEVMDTSQEFSFFGDSGWAPSSSSTAKPSTAVERHLVAHNPRNEPELRDKKSGRPEHVPDTETKTETESASDHRTCACTWQGKEFTIPVWIGPSHHHHHPHPHHMPAVNEYMRLLRANPHLCADPEPASPNHVSAGVPPGSYIFSAAWGAILAPPPPTNNTTTTTNATTSTAATTGHHVRKPTRAELLGMRDVVAAIKAYRAQARGAYGAVRKAGAGKEVPLGAPHYHWTGTLEVLVEDTRAHYQQSRFWR